MISGAATAVARAAELAKAKGAKRAIMLPVSAPFHCALMEPAARAMEEKLGAVEMVLPAVPVIANVTASAVTDPAEIRRLLVEQVTALVRWRESVLAMRAHDVDTVVELGAGKVLSGLVKRISKDMNAISAGAPADLDALLKLF